MLVERPIKFFRFIVLPVIKAPMIIVAIKYNTPSCEIRKQTSNIKCL